MMIKIRDNENSLTIKSLIDFLDQAGSGVEWIIFDLEYSGGQYKGQFPKEIENKSKLGLEFNSEEFLEFERTINQIIEGEIIVRDSEERRECNRAEQGSIIKAIICDGSFWEIGGKKGSEFIAAKKLTII